MSKLKNLVKYAKSASVEPGAWQIAIRKKADIPLYRGNAAGFKLVPNSYRYWRADPFLFKKGRTSWLFAEMFDRKKRKGVIGVAKIRSAKCGRFRVCLELPFHLSYPYVYEKDGEVYMIPECSASGEIAAFRAVSFPLKWEKHSVIQPIPAVDTTPVFNDNRITGYFTSLFEPQNGGNDNLCFLGTDGRLTTLYSDNTQVRSAGRIISEGPELIRPAQNSERCYGGSLYFCKIDDLNADNYSEHRYLHVLPPKSECKEGEVAISLVDKKAEPFEGVHTYNHNEDYEVVDLCSFDQPRLFYLKENRKKILNHIIKRFK